MPIFAPSVFGLTKSGPRRPAAVERGDHRLALHQQCRRRRQASGAGQREGGKLVLAEMRRGRRAAEAREAFEPRQRRDGGAAVEADTVGHRPDNRPLPLGRKRREPSREGVERDEFGLDSSALEPSRNLLGKQAQVGRLREIDGDLGRDFWRVAVESQPPARRLLGLEDDQGGREGHPGQTRGGAMPSRRRSRNTHFLWG